jgi:hypothetical protein
MVGGRGGVVTHPALPCLLYRRRLRGQFQPCQGSPVPSKSSDGQTRCLKGRGNHQRSGRNGGAPRMPQDELGRKRGKASCLEGGKVAPVHPWGPRMAISRGLREEEAHLFLKPSPMTPPAQHQMLGPSISSSLDQTIARALHPDPAPGRSAAAASCSIEPRTGSPVPAGFQFNRPTQLRGSRATGGPRWDRTHSPS